MLQAIGALLYSRSMDSMEASVIVESVNPNFYSNISLWAVGTGSLRDYDYCKYYTTVQYTILLPTIVIARDCNFNVIS